MIKILPNNIAVIEGDTHISAWVEQAGKLCHDDMVEKLFLPLIKDGDTVIDVGANIGDHTVAYMKKAGRNGNVHAFEPHPHARACLEHNLIYGGSGAHSCVHPQALSDRIENICFHPLKEIPGASFVHGSDGIVMQTTTLDHSITCPVHFIKIDCEGYDFFVLRGAVGILQRFKPKVVIEMNKGHMSRYGVNYNDVIRFLSAIGYTYRPLSSGNNINDEQYDLLCVPIK